MKTKQGSLGSKIMIAQEQYNHMKRLNQICQRSGMITENTYKPNYEEIKYKRLLHSRSAKLQNFQQLNHMRTIRHLIERLNCPKTMQDRIKDPHDFFAYPTLFFRQVLQKKFKAKKGKENLKLKKTEKSKLKSGTKKNQLNRIKSQNRFQPMKNNLQENQKHNGLSLEKVKSQIPFLYFFQQENLQQFADALTKLIFNYNLNSLDDIQFLYECVQKTMPHTYPQSFKKAVDEMFTQIAQSLGIK